MTSWTITFLTPGRDYLLAVMNKNGTQHTAFEECRLSTLTVTKLDHIAVCVLFQSAYARGHTIRKKHNQRETR